MIRTIVRTNTYMDSIFLMNASCEIMKVKGVRNAVVVMGTDMNKTVLSEFGGLTEEAKNAGANDLILSVDISAEEQLREAEARITALLTKKEPKSEGRKSFSSFKKAREAMPEANLAVISLPGAFAAQEAITALNQGMHVFMFSDNVPLEDELEMKRIGREKGLLVMGPGAGTAVIDGISIGLMSKVRRGNIGIVAASGSGLQEVAMLVHQYGLGVSQAIGTGGRDLSKDVGGSTMLMGISILENDPDTKVIVLISKPPHPDTALKIYAQVKTSKKPAVIFFLGGDTKAVAASGALAASTLEEAAQMAAALAREEKWKEKDTIAESMNALAGIAAQEKAKLKPEQKYMRGLFCGGTHSEEAVLLLQKFVPSLHSNIKFGKAEFLQNRHVSLENSLVDMGDEEFTKGKPHPVMDPSILNGRLLQEGADPAVGVILFDLLLGYAVHKDPVGAIEEALRKIAGDAKAQDRSICLIASICGTDLDPQGFDKQKRRLEDLGVRVLESNGKAALLAGLIVS